MSFFEDQEEAWWNGGREWYMKQNDIEEGSPEALQLGIPGDFDPYVFWAEKDDEEDNKK